MVKDKDVLETILDKMGHEPEFEVDNALRWDGSDFYIVERTIRDGRQTKTRKKIVTLAVAKRLKEVLKERS